MKKDSRLLSNETGLAHLGLILLALVVVGAGGFAAMRVMNNNKDKNVSVSQQAAADESQDAQDAKDLANADSQATSEVNADEQATANAQTAVEDENAQ